MTFIADGAAYYCRFKERGSKSCCFPPRDLFPISGRTTRWQVSWLAGHRLRPSSQDIQNPSDFWPSTPGLQLRVQRRICTGFPLHSLGGAPSIFNTTHGGTLICAGFRWFSICFFSTPFTLPRLNSDKRHSYRRNWNKTIASLDFFKCVSICEIPFLECISF